MLKIRFKEILNLMASTNELKSCKDFKIVEFKIVAKCPLFKNENQGSFKCISLCHHKHSTIRNSLCILLTYNFNFSWLCVDISEVILPMHRSFHKYK